MAKRVVLGSGRAAPLQRETTPPLARTAALWAPETSCGRLPGRHVAAPEPLCGSFRRRRIRRLLSWPPRHDVNRVWYTSQPTGTHTGTLRLGASEHAATGRRWEAAPERGSLTFDGEGKCIAMTGGYVMDRRAGNTAGLGGVYGLCAALGLPTPTPAWLLRTPTQLWSRVTGGSN